MIKDIAVLITCHNRREKTILCLQKLVDAYNISKSVISITIFLTDDGCTDGTAEAVKTIFFDFNIHILEGNGILFWAGGMRNSWREALKNGFDAYLLLNDDTFVFENLFLELLKIDEYSRKKYNMSGIYCGSTCNIEGDMTTYGGNILLNRFLYKVKLLDPTNVVQECELGNANIMYVSSEVVAKIGILDNNYVHGAADYDYTLKARKVNIPVLTSTQYCGNCEFDHRNPYDVFRKHNLSERIKYLYNPLTLAFTDNLYYMRKHFPYRYPFYFIVGWFKILFPSFYLKLDFRKDKSKILFR